MAKILKCNIVDILFWCLRFINCFGCSKEPSQEMVLLSVSNMCFRCEIEKNAFHFKHFFTPFYTNLHQYTAMILRAQIQVFMELHTVYPLYVCVCVYDVYIWDP